MSPLPIAIHALDQEPVNLFFVGFGMIETKPGLDSFAGHSKQARSVEELFLQGGLPSPTGFSLVNLPGQCLDRTHGGKGNGYAIGQPVTEAKVFPSLPNKLNCGSSSPSLADSSLADSCLLGRLGGSNLFIPVIAVAVLEAR